MNAQNIIATKLGLFFVSITFLGAPTKLFAMNYPGDSVSVSTTEDDRKIKINSTKFEFKCQNDDFKLTKYKIKEIFQSIAKENSRKREKIDGVKIVDCYISGNKAKYLIQKVNEYNKLNERHIVKLNLPENNIYKTEYYYSKFLGENIWSFERIPEGDREWDSYLSQRYGLPNELYWKKGICFDSYNGRTYTYSR